MGRLYFFMMLFFCSIDIDHLGEANNTDAAVFSSKLWKYDGPVLFIGQILIDYSVPCVPTFNHNNLHQTSTKAQRWTIQTLHCK